MAEGNQGGSVQALKENGGGGGHLGIHLEQLLISQVKNKTKSPLWYFQKKRGG